MGKILVERKKHKYTHTLAHNLENKKTKKSPNMVEGEKKRRIAIEKMEKSRRRFYRHMTFTPLLQLYRRFITCLHFFSLFFCDSYLEFFGSLQVIGSQNRAERK